MNKDMGKVYSVENDVNIQETYAQLFELEDKSRSIRNGEELAFLEQEIFRLTDQLGALLLEEQIQTSLEDPEQIKQEKEVVKALPKKFKNDGYVNVKINTRGNIKITLRVRYYIRHCNRRHGKRHKGVYMGLALLGIHERCTPEFASTVSSWSALLSSFEEVKQVLLSHGVKLGVKVIQRITYRYAERVRRLQQNGIFPLKPGENVAGCRVVVSCDGGRTRLREKKRGPKTKKRRNRYKGAWREPKLLIIYVVDINGKLEKSFSPFIDGNIQGPDALFQLICGYLKGLEIEKADEVLFIADGAQWIWNRIPDFIKILKLDPDKVHEMIDFYHAVEHLGKVAKLRKSWSAKQRKTWIKKQRQLLREGEVEIVVEAVRKLCRGRNGKAITTERNYFTKNLKRMNYPTIKALNLPIGSGAIESAVRRIINMRLKGACIFWCKENAEKILLLRAFYKSGRWNLLKNMANSTKSLLLN